MTTANFVELDSAVVTPFHPSAFILHPYLITPRLEVSINSTSLSASAESLISVLIFSRA